MNAHEQSIHESGKPEEGDIVEVYLEVNWGGASEHYVRECRWPSYIPHWVDCDIYLRRTRIIHKHTTKEAKLWEPKSN